MIKLEHWTEPVKGLYRYEISTYGCYEIYVKYHKCDTSILSANCELYFAEEWINNNSKIFERRLVFKGSLADCLKAAQKDDDAAWVEGM